MNNDLILNLLSLAEKSFAVFVACYLMIRLEYRLNNLCSAVQNLITAIVQNKL